MRKIKLIELITASTRNKVIASIIAGTVVVGGTAGIAVAVHNSNSSEPVKQEQHVSSNDSQQTAKAEDTKKADEQKKEEQKKADEEKKKEEEKKNETAKNDSEQSTSSSNSSSSSNSGSVKSSSSSSSSNTSKSTTSYSQPKSSSSSSSSSKKTTSSNSNSSSQKNTASAPKKSSRPSGYDANKTLEINEAAKQDTIVPRYGTEMYNQLVQAAMTVANGGSAIGMKVGKYTVCGETCKTKFLGNEPGDYYGFADVPNRKNGYITYFVCYWNSAKNGYDEKAIAIGF